MTRQVGRPRASSAETLADAASELCLELGYPAVTVEGIARRAGVSRSTFFAYFDSKSDVLWADLDQAIDRACAAVADAPDDAAVALALAAAVAPWRDQVPWALRDAATIDAVDDLVNAAPSRVARLVGLVAQRLAVVVDADPGDAVVLAHAGALVGAAIAAIAAWSRAGRDRGPAEDAVRTALAPLARTA